MIEPTLTELDKADDLPKMSAIEEQVARYGQMVLWLRHMARETKNPWRKHQLTVMKELAIKEFIEHTGELAKITRAGLEKVAEEDRKVDDQLLELRGQRFKFLEEE